MTWVLLAFLAPARGDDAAIADQLAEVTTRGAAPDFGTACPAHPWLCEDWQAAGFHVVAATACESGDALACLARGLAYQYVSGVQDAGEAAAAYGRACELGLDAGCWRLGKVYQGGIQGHPDWERAAELYQGACSRGYAPACNSLALAHTLGVGLPKDKNKALTLYVEACRGGFAEACTNLDRALQVESPEAKSGLEAACASGRGEACRQRATGADDARDWLQKGCDAGSPRACSELGTLLGSADLHEKACKAGYRLGCVAWDVLSSDGDGPVPYLDDACAVGGLAPACARLAERYRTGSGVPKDKAKAKELGLRACQLGDLGSC